MAVGIGVTVGPDVVVGKIVGVAEGAVAGGVLLGVGVGVGTAPVTGSRASIAFSVGVGNEVAVAGGATGNTVVKDPGIVVDADVAAADGLDGGRVADTGDGSRVLAGCGVWMTGRVGNRGGGKAVSPGACTGCSGASACDGSHTGRSR